MTKRSRLLRPLVAMAFVPAALAAPMGFKDSAMAMVDISPTWREAWVNYAVTPRDAFGAGGLFMRSDDRRLEREAVEANYTRLVQRWNLPNAQANAWLLAGLGALRGNDFDGRRTLVAPGAQLDWETTRLYLAATFRAYRASRIRHDYGSARAGFAFTEADYEAIQPWLIVEARRMRGLSEKTEVTPMLRLIHRRFFAELGVNQHREARLNLMIVY